MPTKKILLWAVIWAVIGAAILGSLACLLINPTPILPCPPFAPTSVPITYPAEGNEIAEELIIARGTACHIPPSKELWLFVETAGIAGYFPQGGAEPPTPIVVSHDEWTASARLAESGRQFVLHMALVDQNSAGRKTINKYFEEGKKTGEYKPIKSLPAGIELISQVRVKRK